MIITSEIKLEIGKILTQETNPSFRFDYIGQKVERFAIKIIREASLEEFRKSCEEELPQYKGLFLEYDYFYEVQTD